MIWLAAIAGVLGLALLLIGLRGRRTDAAALCRRCRFELAPAATEPRPERCPECGRTTERVRVGHRRRLRTALGASAALLLLALALGGYQAATTLGGANAYKPVWMLRAEIASADAAVQTEAIDELLLRLSNNTIGKSAALRLADRALGVQADRDKVWNPKVADLIEELHYRFGLDGERLERYARNGIQLRARARDTVRPGSLLPVQVEPLELRLGPNAGFGYMVSLRNAEGIRPAEAPPMPEPVDRPFVRFGYRASGAWGRPGIAVADDAEPGPVSIEVRVLALPEMIGQGTRGEWGSDAWLDEAGGRAIAQWEEVIQTQPVRVVTGPDFVIPIKPEAFTGEPPEIRLDMHGGSTWTRLHADVVTRSPSVPMAFRVEVELSDGRTATSFPVLIAASAATGSHSVPVRFDPPLGEADRGIGSARVRITPAPDAIWQTMDITNSFFGGPMDLGEVPIRFTDVTGGGSVTTIIKSGKAE